MSVALLEALAADLLEDEDLVGLGIVIQNSGLDHRTIYVRSTDLDTRVTSDEEYLVELYISTIRSREAVDEDLIASLYLELLACNFYVFVYTKPHNKFRPSASAIQTALFQWLSGHNKFWDCKFSVFSPFCKIFC